MSLARLKRTERVRPDVSGDLAKSKLWEPYHNFGLPDCRLEYSARDNNRVVVGRVACDVVFCANCHQKAGLAPAEHTPFIFFICNDCAHLGKPPGTVQVPDEIATRRKE
jgi:hypothetical protein